MKICHHKLFCALLLGLVVLLTSAPGVAAKTEQIELSAQSDSIIREVYMEKLMPGDQIDQRYQLLCIGGNEPVLRVTGSLEEDLEILGKAKVTLLLRYEGENTSVKEIDCGSVFAGAVKDIPLRNSQKNSLRVTLRVTIPTTLSNEAQYAAGKASTVFQLCDTDEDGIVRPLGPGTGDQGISWMIWAALGAALVAVIICVVLLIRKKGEKD